MNGELIPRVPRPGKEAHKIREMFGQIAPRYDVLNHVLSGGVDIVWRDLVVRETVTGGERAVLDVACGTGDLALALRKRLPPTCRVVGADFTGPMLHLADDKTHPRAPRMHWVQADGLRLPFLDDSFDLLTIAFGIRNMESLTRALSEFRRVLRPGGQVAILEFSQPENPAVNALYQPYFLHVLPRIGAAISQRSAYRYLPHSVLHFPSRHELARLMTRQGFANVRHCALSFGIAALHLGRKPAPENSNGHR